MNGDQPETIKAHQSSQVNLNTLLIATGIYKLIKMIHLVVIKAPFGALALDDIVDVLIAIQVLATAGYLLWKRIYRPENRPILPGPVTNAVARATGTTQIPPNGK